MMIIMMSKERILMQEILTLKVPATVILTLKTLTKKTMKAKALIKKTLITIIRKALYILIAVVTL